MFAEGFGYRDLEKKLPVENTTRIAIGTLTLGFTATLVADAVSKGQLKWDQPLREILGKDFRLQGGSRSKKATIRDLLSHRLGMPNYQKVSLAALNVSREELCMKYVKHKCIYICSIISTCIILIIIISMCIFMIIICVLLYAVYFFMIYPELFNS